MHGCASAGFIIKTHNFMGNGPTGMHPNQNKHQSNRAKATTHRSNDANNTHFCNKKNLHILFVNSPFVWMRAH